MTPSLVTDDEYSDVAKHFEDCAHCSLATLCKVGQRIRYMTQWREKKWIQTELTSSTTDP